MAPLLPEGRIDTLGVFEALQAVPSQIESALAADVEMGGSSVPVAGIVLVASGADAQVAEAAQALVAPHAPIPVLVHHGFGLPSFVSDAWRCIFVAHGSTPEAHDALARAGVDRADVVAIGDGPVVEAAAEAGYGTVDLGLNVPAPRFAFAGSLVALLRLLERYGAISTRLGDGDVEGLARAAIERIRVRIPQLTDGGEASRLARRIGRTLPLIYGTGALGGVAAARWKNQCNDNVKVAAFANAVPGVIHHELSGWGQHGDMTRQVFTLITLRHDFEHQRETDVMPAVEELVEEVVAARHEIRAGGEGPLAQLLDLTVTGDVTSFYLAQENEIDPGPTAVDDLIRRLS